MAEREGDAAGQAPAAEPVRVLISYAQYDEKHSELVQAFWTFLRTEGIDARLDVMAANQRQFWPQWMSEEIRAAAFVIVVASPAYRERAEHRGDVTVGRGVRWESRQLQERLYRDWEDGFGKIVPVVLPGGRIEDLPDWVLPFSGTNYTIREFSSDAADALLRLLTGQPLHTEPELGQVRVRPPRSQADSRPPVGHDPVVSVPPLPRDTVARKGLTDRLVRLLTDPDRDTGTAEAPAVRIATALLGTGGFGKTRLATMVCHNADVRGYFRDGVVWVTLGEQVTGPELAGKINDLCWQMTAERPPLTDPNAAGAELGQVLNGRRMLLVIDDVWTRSQLEPFLNGGHDVIRLVTTRQQNCLPPNTNVVDVDAMNVPEANQLLTGGLGRISPGLVDQLLDATGRWPVLLSLVHGAARTDLSRGGSVSDSLTGILQRLLARGPASLDVRNPDQLGSAVGLTMDASLRRLSVGQIDRYVDLAVFPEDVDIPRPVLERYWAGMAGWDSDNVHDFCGLLADLSLVQEYRLDPPRLRLHDVIRSYLMHRADCDLPRRHATLIDAYRDLVQQSAENPFSNDHMPTWGRDGTHSMWWRLPARELYLWTWIGYHLHHADLDNELARCLHSASYLAAKLTHVGPEVVETELGYLTDPLSVELHAAVQQSAHLLAPLGPAGSLEATFASRLMHRSMLTPIAVDIRKLRPGRRLQTYAAIPDAPSPALRRVLAGHTDQVRAIVVSPDGSWIASAGWDHTVRIWDPAIGSAKHTLVGHTAEVQLLALAPDGDWLASAGNDSTVRIWDPDSGTETHTMNGHTGPVGALAPAPDGGWLASADDDGTVRIWDPIAGTKIHTLLGHGGPVRALAAAPSSSWVASASWDGTVRIWDPVAGAEINTLKADTGGVNALAVTSDGRWLATAGMNGTVGIWDPIAGTAAFSLNGHAGPVHALAVAPDGLWLAAAGGTPFASRTDNRVHVWDLATGLATHTLDAHTDSINTLVVSPHGSWLASAGDDGKVRIWDPVTGGESQTMTGDANGVQALAVAPDGDWLASAGHDGTVRIWDPITSPGTHDHPGHIGPILALAGTSKAWLASAGADGTVRIWDPDKGVQTRILNGHSGPVRALAAASDSRWLASASGALDFVPSDTTVRIWDPIAGIGAQVLTGHTGAVSTLAAAPSDNWLASGSYDGTVRIWDPVVGKEIHTLTGHGGPVQALVVGPEGHWLASASWDHTVRLWDPVTGSEILNLSGHTGAVNTLAIAPSGQWLASASADGTVRIWDPINTPSAAAALRVDGAIQALHVLGDDRLVAAGAHGPYWLRFGT